MKSLIFIVATSLFLFSCGQKEVKSVSEPTAEVSKEEKLKLDDPIFYAGSSFGHHFQSLFKKALFDELVELTDGKSRSTIGDSIIRGFYRNIDFAFEMKLDSKISDGNLIWLNYECQIDATKKIFRFPVVVQNNSCKVDFRQFKASLENI